MQEKWLQLVFGKVSEKNPAGNSATRRKCEKNPSWIRGHSLTPKKIHIRSRSSSQFRNLCCHAKSSGIKFCIPDRVCADRERRLLRLRRKLWLMEDLLLHGGGETFGPKWLLGRVSSERDRLKLNKWHCPGSNHFYPGVTALHQLVGQFRLFCFVFLGRNEEIEIKVCQK